MNLHAITWTPSPLRQSAASLFLAWLMSVSSFAAMSDKVLRDEAAVMKSEERKTHGYAPVNGLSMYYEIEGTGDPLVYIPPVLSVVGMKSFAALARNHTIITMDLQGHGRTVDIPDRPLSIEQFADDVVALLCYLGIRKVDLFGESYGAATAVMIAIKHPDMVGRVVTFGGTFGPPEAAHNIEMLHYDRPPTPDSSSHSYHREKYQEVSSDPGYWPKIWQKVVSMRWDGFSSEQLAAIESPVLIAVGDRDFVRVEHAADTSRRIQNAELTVIPDAGHFVLYSEPDRVLPMVQHFLEKPATRRPVATAEMGYRPGKTR